LFQGHQECLPPWLEVNDFLLYETLGLDPPNIQLGVVRKVTRLPHLQTQDDEEEDMDRGPNQFVCGKGLLEQIAIH